MLNSHSMKLKISIDTKLKTNFFLCQSTQHETRNFHIDIKIQTNFFMLNSHSMNLKIFLGIKIQMWHIFSDQKKVSFVQVIDFLFNPLPPFDTFAIREDPDQAALVRAA